MSRAMDLAVTDAERELEEWIERATLRMLSAKTPTDRRIRFILMRDLIARRSPEMVERMERAAGLHCVTQGECDGRR